MANGLFTLKQQVQALRQGAWSGYIAPKWVEYLVVAGGGAGGASIGGGGGAGGLLTGIVTVAAGTSYTVTVGAGGSGSTGAKVGNNGSNSVFGAISSTGGGGGGAYDGEKGAAGGSGGGGGAKESGIQPTGGAGIPNQGNSGGLGMVLYSIYAGGGGGGAGTAGLSTVPATTYGANGGAGIASAITGSVATYAGGGGGAVHSSGTAGIGGVGGGGAGAPAAAIGTYGAVNTGGGAGGSSYNLSSASGGSGIVIIRYPGNVQFYTGGAITYANGYIVHTFVASGTLAPTTPTVLASDYQISRSLRFNSADSAYLNRTPASATNRTTWTWSAWVKRGTLGTTQILFVGAQDSSNYTNIYFSGSVTDNLELYTTLGGGNYYTTSVFRDPSAWYHIVYSVDTTQATAANRVQIYVNNVLQPTTVSVAISQNTNTYVNSANPHYLGRNAPSSQYFNGYMTEVNFIDGQALTPSSFGATNPNTGVWSPKAYTGTYGTNGFYLNFSDNSNTTAATLGKDYSGNGNNWTPNNFSVTAGSGNDSLVDTPTPYGSDYGLGGVVRGNYATLNPLSTAYTDKTFSDGNLQVTGTTLNQVGGHSTIQIPSTGQWYAECVMTASGGGSPFIGVNGGTSTLGSSGASYRADGNKELNGSGSSYGATWTTNDVIGVAVDTSAGSITFYKNGVSQGVAYTTLNSTFTSGLFFSCQGATGTATFVYNFGQRAFAYAAPGGYKALCTQNLPTPTVGSSPTTLATNYFTPNLWAGNDGLQTVTNNIDTTNGGGLIWFKGRNLSVNHFLVNSGSGYTKFLASNSTAAEDTYDFGFTPSTTGFSFNAGSGSVNQSGYNYVAWQWKAGGTAVTNTSGTITSQVSANPTSGFSVMTYTGNGTDNATIGHGLGVAPSMIIIKSRSNITGWPVWHGTFAANDYMVLDTTAAKASASSLFGGSNASLPTSTVFKVGTNGSLNASSYTYVAYCFAEVAGYSKFGSYTGNGSTDGPFVFTGFRPAYVMIKSSSNASNWTLLDSKRNTYNVVNSYLDAELASAEGTFTFLDFLSNGFKIRTTDTSANGGDPRTYVYAAFAENPFKYSLAR